MPEGVSVTVAALEAAIQLQAGLVCVARGFQHPRDLLDRLNFDLRTDLIDHPYIMAIDICWITAPRERRHARHES
jgi:hypothetical protein